jgi:hypothetical protein
VRFERSVSVSDANSSQEHEQLFADVLVQLQRRGVVTQPKAPARPRVVESHLIAAPNAEQLITPGEWQVLVEGVRRVSLAVAHLVGPKEAMNVLGDILDDCSAGFPALAGMHINASGYVQVTPSQLNSIPREEMLEGFVAFFATCQHFCSPIIGEEDAHKLIIQALNDIGPALVTLGVFHFGPLSMRPL